MRIIGSGRVIGCFSTRVNQLGEMTMQSQTIIAGKTRTALLSKGVELLSALLLGIVVLYGSGFVSTSVVHNAAHDMRHAIGFPCH